MSCCANLAKSQKLEPSTTRAGDFAEAIVLGGGSVGEAGKLFVVVSRYLTRTCSSLSSNVDGDDQVGLPLKKFDWSEP